MINFHFSLKKHCTWWHVSSCYLVTCHMFLAKNKSNNWIPSLQNIILFFKINLVSTHFVLTNVISANTFLIKWNHTPFHFPVVKQFKRKSKNVRMGEGVIERSDSLYNNPLVTVVKPDGLIRLCFDARRLNTITLLTRDPFSSIDEILATISRKCVLSFLDFSSGYWQIPLEPSAR